MLISAALRGCKVLMIGPALENAPSSGFPQMSRAHELFTRLIIARNGLASEIESAGGMLKIGLYARSSKIGDFEASLEEFKKGIQENPFIREVFPFGPEVYNTLEVVRNELVEKGFKRRFLTEDEGDRRVKLHLKTNFFISQHMGDFLGIKGWDKVMYHLLLHYASLGGREKILIDIKDIPEELSKAGNDVINKYVASMTEEELDRILLYLTIGSQNQNNRSIIMDAEAAVLISGADSLEALIDLFFMSGLTTWVHDLETLNRLLPPETGWKLRFSRFIKIAL